MKKVYCVKVCNGDVVPAARFLVENYLELKGMIKHGEQYLIKPNLVAPVPSAVTRTELIGTVAEMVLEYGGRPVIGETGGNEFDTETIFNILGIRELAERLGVPLVDLSTMPQTELSLPGVGKVMLPKLIFEVGGIINLPRLKMHRITVVSLSAKNLFGFLHPNSRRKAHLVNLHRAIFELGQIIKPICNILDASTGVLDRAVFGKSAAFNILIGGNNAWAVDIAAMQIMGVPIESVKYIALSKMNQQEISLLGDWDCVQQQDLFSRINQTKLTGSQIKYFVLNLLDSAYMKITGRNTIQPFIHFYMGIRPKIDLKLCDYCKICIEICPVQAIAPNLHIGPSCYNVRCMQCIEVCPQGAIKAWSMNRPVSIFNCPESGKYI